MEGHCLQVIKIVHHHANGRFDWLISEQQSVNPSREAISILSGKYKGFTFVRHVDIHLIAFNRLVYREIELNALTLMTSSKTRVPELSMITRDFYSNDKAPF